jgi:toxin YoeB
VVVAFTKNAWEEYLYWQRKDPKIVERINLLVREMRRDPFEGLGKPEPLRAEFSGYWSRRIDQEHRLVYRVDPGMLRIVQCRYHY